MSICVICSSSVASPCFKCQIAKLTAENAILQKKLRYFQKQSHPILTLSENYYKFFEVSSEYLPIVLQGQYSDYHFITLTFDPSKFGQYNDEHDEKNYILMTIKLFQDLYKPLHLTGCFEYQGNGTIHGHFIISTNLNDEAIQSFFQPFFTDNKKNYRAVKSLPAKFPTVEDYLRKEALTFFRYDCISDLESGLELDRTIKPLQEHKHRSTALQDWIDLESRSIACQVNFKL